MVSSSVLAFTFAPALISAAPTAEKHEPVYHRFYGLCATDLFPREEGKFDLHESVSRDQCKDMCTEDSKCTAYQWSSKHRNCKLEYSTINYVHSDADTEKHEATCVVKQQDGPYHRFYGLCATDLFPREEGKFDLHESVSRDQCKDMCTEDSKCTAYQWSSKHRNCKLERSTIKYVQSDADTEKYEATCVVKF